MQYLRELLDNDVLKAQIWSDTRDMLADGLTKDSIDRDAMHRMLEGIVDMKHECKWWSPTRTTSAGSQQ